MESKLKCESIDTLFAAVLALENVEECYRFFADLTTIPELKSLAQRLQVAQLLLENETYNSISKATGASTATISRVKNALLYGEDGYKLIIERQNNNSRREG